MSDSQRLWDKGTPIDQAILEFTVGDDHLLDARLVRYDVQASIAHVTMLNSVGHLTDQEAATLSAALTEIGESHAQGEWTVSLTEEDCHTALEARLTERLGSLGGKVHLGRSRNDQVLVALRLYLRDAVTQIEQGIDDCRRSLRHLAEVQGDIAVPGYTHLQQAMPSSVRLWALGYESELHHSASSLQPVRELIALNPLGSAAGYGTPGLKLDRQKTTDLLGFSSTHEPVTACQLSRGKAEASLAFAVSLILGDLGRLSADICLYASQEFGFVTLADDVTTGSSIMPQKRNPDVFELVRGHAAQAPTDLQAILALTSKMTSGYHRDLQLVKGPLFRTIDRSFACLKVMDHAITRITFSANRAAAVTSPEIHAAEEAFALVQSEGISFREAYRKIASRQSQ